MAFDFLAVNKALLFLGSQHSALKWLKTPSLNTKPAFVKLNRTTVTVETERYNVRSSLPVLLIGFFLPSSLPDMLAKGAIDVRIKADLFITIIFTI